MNMLYFLKFLWSTGTNMVRRVFPAYLAGFIDSAFLIGLINTGYDIGKSMSLPCGFAVDKMGKVRAIMASFLLISIIAVLVSLTFNIAHLIFLFILIGVVSNLFYTSTNALISFQKKKTESIFKMEAFYQSGLFLGPIIGGFIISFYSMTLGLYAWAVLGIIGFIASLLLSKKEFVEEKKKDFSGFLDQFKKEKSRFFVIFLVGTVFTGFLFSTINLLIPLYAVSLGMAVYQAGLIFGFGAIVSTVGFFLLSKRFEKISPEKGIIITILLAGSMFLVLGNAYDIIILAVVFGLFNIGRGGSFAIARAFISKNTSQEMRSTGMAFLDTLHFSGGVVGSITTGLLIDLVSMQSVMLLSFSISVVGVFIILIYNLTGRKHAA